MKKFLSLLLVLLLVCGSVSCETDPSEVLAPVTVGDEGLTLKLSLKITAFDSSFTDKVSEKKVYTSEDSGTEVDPSALLDEIMQEYTHNGLSFTYEITKASCKNNKYSISLTVTPDSEKTPVTDLYINFYTATGIMHKDWVEGTVDVIQEPVHILTAAGRWISTDMYTKYIPEGYTLAYINNPGNMWFGDYPHKGNYFINFYLEKAEPEQ